MLPSGATMNHASRTVLILASLTALSGCVTYPSGYIAAGPGGYVDCRYEPCSRDGYTYWSGSSRSYGYADSSWYASGPAWYGSSRWYAPYRVGYTTWGFRDPWYDPWYGSSWTWASPWYPAWHSRSRSNWYWSVGYGWSSGPWSGSLWYRPWSYSSGYGSGWYGSGWYGGGWSSTWHRPYRGHRPPPRERHVDWRPAEGIGVANPRWLPASEEVQRIADRSLQSGSGRAFESGAGNVYEPRRVEPVSYRGGDIPESTRLDRPAGRVMPRGAADGWVAPMPGSRPTGGERWADDGLAVERSQPQRFEPPEPSRYERPMPQRFERSEPARFDPPPQQRFEPPEPSRYERPMPQRFERSEPARFDPPPQRFEAPEPARFDPSPAVESRSSGRRFGREDFEPN
jgi:hypothetical protein